MYRLVHFGVTLTEKSARRRAAMLEAATAVFLERGYEGATLGEIIARSGGSRATLYVQFGDKAGLFGAIIAAFCERIVAPVAARIEGPAEAALLAVGKGFMRVMMAPESLGLYRIVIAEGARFPELAEAVFSAGPKAAADGLTRYLAEKVGSGELALGDPHAAARHFLEMVKGDLHFRALLGLAPAPSEAEVEKCVAVAVKTFLDGARPRR
jgi:TetR/AcrR family transcriptional regulator, mexJK operon transcriptional repressor